MCDCCKEEMRRLAERIEETERDQDENSVDHAELANRIETCTERIEAVELGLRRQGKDGLQDHAERMNMLSRIDRISAEQDSEIQLRCDLANRLAAVETKQGDWKSRANQSQQAAERLMEARQQDEAPGVSFVSQTIRDESLILGARRELSREIVTECERAVQKGALHPAARSTYGSIARWIKREFLAQGVGSETP